MIGTLRSAARSVAVLALFVASIAGCGSSSQPSAKPLSAYAMTHPDILPNTRGNNPDSFYVPGTIAVRVGQVITWTNKDTDPHDVTSVDGVFSSGPIANGASYHLVLHKSGTYRFFCTLHPEMHGVIVVRR